MNPSPFAVSPNTHVSQVFNLFRTMGLRHLPVVNAVGEVSPYLSFVLAEQGSRCVFCNAFPFERVEICFNIKQICFNGIRMWSSGFEALLISVTSLPSLVSKSAPCFHPKEQDTQSVSFLRLSACGSCYCLVPFQSPWAHQRSLIWLPLWQLWGQEQDFLNVGQEVFLLDRNLHSVLTHRSRKIKKLLNGLRLICCTYLFAIYSAQK